MTKDKKIFYMHRVCETSDYKKYDVYFYSKYAS